MGSRVTELPDDGPASPAGDPPAQPTPVSGSGTILLEAPMERFERLRVQIMQKRQQQAIEDMEKELAGEEPAFRATIPELAPAQSRKRHVSPSAEESTSKRPLERPRPPPEFSGKDIADLDTFDAACRAYFEATEVTKASHMIRVAATYLTGNLRMAWSRKRPDQSSIT